MLTLDGLSGIQDIRTDNAQGAYHSWLNRGLSQYAMSLVAVLARN